MRQLTEHEWQKMAQFQNDTRSKLDRIIKLLEGVNVAPIAEQPAPSETEDMPKQDKQPTLRRCKKCDFTCTDPGEMLKHHREAHKEK